MNNETQKTYKVTLRSIVDVEVEVVADSIVEARQKAFEWHGNGDGVGEFTGYWNRESDFVNEEFTLWWDVCDTNNEIIDVEVVQEEEDEMDFINRRLREGKIALGLDPDITLGPLGELAKVNNQMVSTSETSKSDTRFDQQPIDAEKARFIPNRTLRRLNRIAHENGKNHLADDCPVLSDRYAAPIFVASRCIDTTGWVRCLIPATPDCEKQVVLDIQCDEFNALPVHTSTGMTESGEVQSERRS